MKPPEQGKILIFEKLEKNADERRNLGRAKLGNVHQTVTIEAIVVYTRH
jgi:hypothetical protein